MTITAEFIKDVEGWNGHAELFKLSEEIPYPEYADEDEEKETTDYIVISAANAMFTGPETYIFPADEESKVLDWGELDGSFRGSLDINQALKNAGYTRKEL